MHVDVLPPPAAVRDTMTIAVAMDIDHKKLTEAAGAEYVHVEDGERHAVRIHGKWIDPALPGSTPFQMSIRLPALPEGWRLGEAQSQKGESLVQTLTYLGHDSGRIKVLYREFANNMIKDKFSLEMEYDLSDDPIFGFRGARIEVLEADNRQIKYRVLEPFPDLRQPLDTGEESDESDETDL